MGQQQGVGAPGARPADCASPHGNTHACAGVLPGLVLENPRCRDSWKEVLVRALSSQ